LSTLRNYHRFETLLVGATLGAYAACVLIVANWLEIDEPVLRYAIAFILVQIAIQAALIIGLVVSKHARSRHETARAGRVRRLQELLAAPDASAEAASASVRWPDEFLTVAANALEMLAGSERRRVAGLLQTSAPFDKLLREAGQGGPGRVIRAISLLGRIESPEARAVVRRAVQHPAEAVRRAARKAVVISGEEDARCEVLDGLCALPFWERIILFQLLAADPALHTFLAEALTSEDDERILVALEFILTRQRLLLVRTPARLAQSPNLEVRIKFFRALPFLRLEEDACSVIEPGLRDADWRVRAQAARACGSMRVGRLAPRLLEMCGAFDDPAEAAHAARALSALGGAGWNRLQEVAATGDGAGRRIAAEVMERRMLAGLEAHR
jgi:HEAT repeat protein